MNDPVNTAQKGQSKSLNPAVSSAAGKKGIDCKGIPSYRQCQNLEGPIIPGFGQNPRVHENKFSA